MKLSRSDIEEIITFSQKKAFRIFHETELSYILGGISKAPKTKISYIFPKNYFRIIVSIFSLN